MSLPEGRAARRPQAIPQRGSGTQTYEGECHLRSAEPLARCPGTLSSLARAACREQQQGVVKQERL